MKSWHLPSLVFFGAALLVNSLVVLNSVGDASLLPRFIFLSLVSLGAAVFFARDFLRAKEPAFFWGDLAWGAWYLINLLSVTWAANPVEAIYGAQKVLLFGGVYFPARWLFFQYGELAGRMLTWVAVALTAVLLLVVGAELLPIVQEHGFDKDYMYLVTGLSSHRNLLAGFFMLLLPLNLWAYLDAKGGLRSLILVVLSLQVGLLLVLQVRSIWLVMLALLVLGAVLRFWLLRKSELGSGKSGPGSGKSESGLGKSGSGSEKSGSGLWKPELGLRVLGAGLLLLGVVFLGFFFSGSLSSALSSIDVLGLSASKSGTERLLLWSKSQQVWQEHWALGVGNSNWRIAMPQVGLQGLTRVTEQLTNFKRPHNDWIWVVCETGLLGLGIYLLFWGQQFWALFRGLRLGMAGAWKKTPLKGGKGEVYRDRLLLLFLGLLGYVTFSFFSFPLERIEHQTILALYFALLAYLCRPFLPRLQVGGAAGLAVALRGVTLGLVGGLLVLNLVIGFFRYQGETNSREVFLAVAAKNWPQVSALTADGVNPFFNLSHWGDPIELHQGVAAIRLQQLEAAVAPLENALLVNPGSYLSHNNLAVALFSLEKVDEAEAHLRSALAIQPDYGDALYNLAVLLYGRQDYAGSKEFLLRMDPGDARRGSLLAAVEQGLRGG